MDSHENHWSYVHNGKRRCDASFSTERYRNSAAFPRYHDEVWGKPTHDDHELFVALCLEVFSAGLSFIMVLEKEKNFRDAMDDLDPNAIARYDDAKIDALLETPGLIRNRKKYDATVANARAFLRVQEEFGSFDAYIWRFTAYKQIDRRLKDGRDMPSRDETSDRVAKDLKTRGFKFIGSVTAYSYLQAIGVVNDHSIDCDFRH